MENEVHEVDTTTETKGQIVTGTKAWGLPTPSILSNWMDGVIYFSASAITLVSGSDVFTDKASSIITFLLGLSIIASGAIKKSVGVDPNKK